MSAFVVDEAHVKQLALAWNWGPYNNHTPEEITETARELFRENIRSVACRYDDELDTREADLIEVTLQESRYGCRLQPVEILSMCDCLEYQSCETEGYFGSTACDLLRAIRKAAIKRLPGYDDAPWDYRKPSAAKGVTS